VFANSLARHADLSGEPTAETLALAVRALSWPGIELRHLTALCGIAAERSFVRAATRLGYTQSAVSQQIAALERAVGHRLLERTHGRGPVELTPAGRILVRHADVIARELSRTRASLGVLDHVRHELAVGIHRTTGLHLLPEIIGRMQKEEAPRLRVHESADEPYLLALVEYDELDVAFVHLPTPPDLSFVELVNEQYVAVAAGALADELSARPVDPTTLAGLPLLVLHAPYVRLELGAYFQSAGIALAAAFEGEDPSMLCELAERGRGIALLPRSLATASGQDVRIFALREPPTRRLGIVWREDAPRARHLRPQFIAAATGALADETEKQSPLAEDD
jgi:DNA-binding transcriptional LysR family regulator